MFSKQRETQTQVGESQPDSPVLGKESNALFYPCNQKRGPETNPHLAFWIQVRRI